MTSHRATDLSHGQLGEINFDIEENALSFSRIPNNKRIIQQLSPLKQCLKPVTEQEAAHTRTDYQGNSEAHTTWLSKTVPTAQQSKRLLFDLKKRDGNLAPELSSSLISIGKALNSQHPKSSPARTIFAIGGPANTVRLIEPRLKYQGWEEIETPSLETYSFECDEERSSRWAGLGGTIQQVIFADDVEGPTSWLAVRQNDRTTILRSTYSEARRTQAGARAVPLGSGYLDGNEKIVLRSDQTGSRPHVDVAFNPWYPRQFAVMDFGGFWSVWDIAGSKTTTRNSLRLVAGKSGNLHAHDEPQDDTLAAIAQTQFDGWGRCLWIGGADQIILCNRKRLVVYNLQGEGQQILEVNLFKPSSMDWILDIKIDPLKSDHFLVLTSSRVFWLCISEPAGDETSSSASILLSHRHFRDSEDLSLKFDIVMNDQDCFVFVYSYKNLLVNVMKFSHADCTAAPTCSSDVIKLLQEDASEKVQIQTLVVRPAQIDAGEEAEVFGPGADYLEQEISFFQLIGVCTNGSLVQAVCATSIAKQEKADLVYQSVQLPRALQLERTESPSTGEVLDDFVVSDDVVDAELEASRPVTIAEGQQLEASIGPRKFDATKYFNLAYDNNIYLDNSTGLQIANNIQKIYDTMEERTSYGLQGSNSALEICTFEGFTQDIDEAFDAMQECFMSLTSYDEAESALALVVTNPRPGIAHMQDCFTADGVLSLPDIYDSLVRGWISSLPDYTPDVIRLSKERLIRSIAMELYLSATIVTMKDKSTENVDTTEPLTQDSEKSASQSLFASGGLLTTSVGSQLPSSSSSHLPDHRLPTPSATESIASASVAGTSSYGSSFSGSSSISGNDGAIALLRNYTTVRAGKPLGRVGENLLKHWNPRQDPDLYSYDETRKAIAAEVEPDSDDEEGQAERKRQKRMKRHIEKALKKQRMESLAPSSQPAPRRYFGSQPTQTQDSMDRGPSSAVNIGATQPDPTSLLSSQPSMFTAMSQPVGGAFGGRLGSRKAGGKKSKRTKGF